MHNAVLDDRLALQNLQLVPEHLHDFHGHALARLFVHTDLDLAGGPTSDRVPKIEREAPVSEDQAACARTKKFGRHRQIHPVWISFHANPQGWSRGGIPPISA